MAIRRPKLIRRVPVASGADSKAIGFQDTREYRRRERVSRRQSDPATTATTSPAASPPAAAAAPAASPTPAAAAAPPPPQPLKAVAPTRPQPAFAPTPPSSTSSIPSFPSSSSSSSSPSSSSSAPSPRPPQSTVWVNKSAPRAPRHRGPGMANRSPVSDRVLQAIVAIQRARRVAGEGARGSQGGARSLESQRSGEGQRSHGGGAEGGARRGDEGVRVGVSGGGGGGVVGSLKEVVAEVAGGLEKREVEELMTELQRRHDWRATLEVFSWSQQQAWFRPNMRLYNALMGFLAREHQAHAATLLFQDMLLTRARPNHFTYTALINAYGRSGWFEDALAVFEHMKTCDEDDCRPNTVTCNALIGALCKGGMYDEAVEVFMDMRSGSGGLPDNCRPNIVTYNTLIDSLCREGQLDAALQVLDDLSSGALDPLVAPNIVTFNTIINACGKAGRAAEAETTLQAMELTGMAADGITYTALVDAYGRTGQVERAEEAFERMVQAGIGPDVFSYTALMAGFGRAGLPERVTETLSAMQRAGVQPNEVTFLTVLDAHGKAGNYEEAEATLAVMVTCGYRPSVYSWSCLIDAFGKAGLYAKAAGAFERMQAEGCRPNLITYAAILSACARCEQWEDALELLYCLQRTGGEWEVAMCRLVMAGPDEEGEECGSEEELVEGLMRGGRRGGERKGERGGERGERRKSGGMEDGLWESAGRMFEAFQPLPLAMRRSFYNALADVLWSFGMHRRAARVVALGRGLGVYGGAEDMHKGGRGGRRGGLGRREGSSSGSEGEGGNQRGGGSGRGMWTEEGIWSVDLHEHSIGSACAFLFLWLRDLRTAWQWHNEIPEAIDIVTGWGRHSKRKDSTSDKPAQVAPLKAAILRELQQMGSPFQELSVNAGRLVAGGGRRTLGCCRRRCGSGCS
ncbi:hypothetical protein CLOM_g16684 [Closterium sp. NIES-68]|nr:hypothetical protein CLOM_g16684 [Closterium sp. NIES-68]